ncbi:alpha/beta hydrolase [Gordonia sp. VNK21]|uniref:alpha/beta hydrolase n=1 Tax=Gordonia sp. VNK21 TaxID=3382483 RepID=UPI0038D38C05
MSTVVRHAYAERRHTYVDVFDPRVQRQGQGPDAITPILLVHGGYWRPRYSSSYLSPFAKALAAKGYRVGNSEYRRIPGCPDIYVKDVIAAAEWFAEHAGAAPLLVGHSVGAQLAIMACSAGAPARAVLLLAPVCDLRSARHLAISDNAVTQYLGAHRINDWDPRLVTTPVREIAIHSPVDLASPIEQSRSRAVAGRCELIEVENSGHYGVVNPLDMAFTVTLRAIKNLTRQYPVA